MFLSKGYKTPARCRIVGVTFNVAIVDKTYTQIPKENLCKFNIRRANQEDISTAFSETIP